MNNLAAGTTLSYTYDAGSNPGQTRIVTLRNYVDSKGGPAMFCHDGRLLKKYLLKHVRNVLIETSQCYAPMLRDDSFVDIA